MNRDKWPKQTDFTKCFKCDKEAVSFKNLPYGLAQLAGVSREDEPSMASCREHYEEMFEIMEEIEWTDFA
ncbi:MAG TPA: hypothetical protein VM577_00180 [Anaerovoracaceae bacterium]|nr:hypothetical protein [Anaerovoracaceae bacterium]